MTLFTGEYRFPLNSIPLLKSVGGITGIVFADAGDTETFGTLPTNFKVDYGFGIAAKTPIGLFRVDYGVGSEGGQLWISTGTTF
jgi:outer membrane translocation and assembly module TamA